MFNLQLFTKKISSKYNVSIQKDERAKVAINKRGAFIPGPPMFLRLYIVSRIMELAASRPSAGPIAMMCLVSYVFLLRVPSEGMPLVLNAHAQGQQEQMPLLWVDESAQIMKLWLPRRKNRLQPSTMLRSCWCHDCKLTCTVHVLGAFVKLSSCTVKARALCKSQD